MLGKHNSYFNLFASYILFAKDLAQFKSKFNMIITNFNNLIVTICYHEACILPSVLLFKFYPITWESRRGNTDDFATISFHLVLFSAALDELAKPIPVHFLYCLPILLLLSPFAVPCKTVISKPEDIKA